ncbi:hypothetical protein, partial [Ideonella livida]
RVDDFARRRLPPGWQLDRPAFDAGLRQAAQDAGVALIAPARLLAAQLQHPGPAPHPGGATAARWWLQVEDAGAPPGGRPRALHARLLVEASGRRASLARLLGHRRLRLDHQVALVGQGPPARPLQDKPHPLAQRSFIEAVPDGWWYACQRPDGRRQLALMTDQDLARRLRHPAAWRTALAQAPQLSAWLADTRLPPSATGCDDDDNTTAAPHPVAAHSGCLASACGPGWLAVGDALMGLDPLSSSGVSGALRDGLDACHQVLLPWLAGAEPAGPGRAWGLRAQQAWQRFTTERQALHAQVHHWPDAPFWARRHAGAMPAVQGGASTPLTTPALPLTPA